MTLKEPIVVTVQIAAPLEEVWQKWVDPLHVVNWNFAAPTWCCPFAQSDLRAEGTFVYRMEARDGSMGFNFGGTFSTVDPETFLAYVLGDGRRVEVKFSVENGQVRLEESFEIEDINTAEQQRFGWQSILNNFKQYVETGRV